MIFNYVLIFIASVLAGGVNAVAGGGTLISFPTLISLDVPAQLSNITNTVALWSGSLLGAIGYKNYMKDSWIYIKKLLAPSLIGGIVGGLLLIYTPSSIFDFIVPFLIFFASLMFSFSNKILGYIKYLGNKNIFIIQLLTAIYGGYFGAGMGIVMLGSIITIGVKDIHIANTIKNTLGFLINLSAAILFIFWGKVVWDYAIIMMMGFAIGGLSSSLIAQKINKRYVRMFINTIGYILSIYYFIKIYIL